MVTDLLKNEKGMTGLETAIILIAFVTVAAVFGYAVLSAGLFSAEQGKEVIYAGLNEANSNLQLTGSVVGKSDNETDLDTIILTVKNTPSGNSIDLTPCDGTSSATNRCVISLTTDDSYLNNVKWTASMLGGTAGSYLLERGKQCQITIDLTDLGDNKTMNSTLVTNETFTVQIKPGTGATISVQRTLPAAMSKVMDLN